MPENEKLVERLIGCVPFDVEDSRTIQEAATALTLAQARMRELETALGSLLHAVCGETGFANAVRKTSGTAYPWPALDLAEQEARQALKEAPDV